MRRCSPGREWLWLWALRVPALSAKDSGFKIMMTPKWTGFPYFEAAAKGGEGCATELGDEFVYAGADHADVSLQVETLQNFLTQKPDAIVLAAIDLNAVAPVLKQARKKGIIVTTFDADAAQDARDMFVNQLSYKQAAKTMLDCALLDAPEGGEIAFVAASPTAPNHTAHIKYMKEYIKDDPKYQVFKVVDTQYANDDDAKSYDVAVNLMQAHPDLKVIISSSAVSAPVGRARHLGERPCRQGVLDRLRAAERDQELSQGRIRKVLRALGSRGARLSRDLCDASEARRQTGRQARHDIQGGQGRRIHRRRGGEIVYGKPLMFTKDNIDQFNF